MVSQDFRLGKGSTLAIGHWLLAVLALTGLAGCEGARQTSAASNDPATQPDQLEYRPVLTSHSAESGQCPISSPVLNSSSGCSVDNRIVYALSQPIFTSKDVIDASMSESAGQYSVLLHLNEEVSKDLSKVTRSLVSQDAPKNELAVVGAGIVYKTLPLVEPVLGGVIEFKTDDQSFAELVDSSLPRERKQ